MTWQAVGCRHLGFGARIPRFGLRGLLSRSFLHETKTRGSRHNWMSDNKERRKLRPGKGKYVPEGTPATWFTLDRARFDILPVSRRAQIRCRGNQTRSLRPSPTSHVYAS